MQQIKYTISIFVEGKDDQECYLNLCNQLSEVSFHILKKELQ